MLHAPVGISMNLYFSAHVAACVGLDLGWFRLERMLWCFAILAEIADSGIAKDFPQLLWLQDR